MWIFSCPKKIAFGEDALDELQCLHETGTRALIVSDKTVAELFLSKLTDPLEEIGFEWKVFTQVEPDPSIETCRKVARLAEEFKPDWIFALGGGSVIDVAKAAFFMYERPDVDISGVVPFENYDLRKKVKGLIAIPTTSGTGADAVHAMVLTDTSEKRKINPTSRELIPDLVILDPIFVAMMPQFLTASTGLDALTHAVEAFISEWKNDFSDALAIQSLKIILKYLPRAFKHGKEDKEAREKMHLAATMAGISFGSSNVGIAHSIGHSLGAQFGLPHGLCVAIYLPRVMEFLAKDDPKRLAFLARELNVTDEKDDQLAVNDLKKRIIDLMNEVQISPRLKDHKITEEEFTSKLDRLIELAGLDTGMLSSPRTPNANDFANLFLAGFHGNIVDF